MSILKHLGILAHKGILSQKGILYANGLLPPSDGFADYYQWLPFSSPTSIVEDTGAYFFENKGTGGEPVRAKIENTQVANFSDALPDYVDFGFKVVGGQPINNKNSVKLDPNDVGAFFSCGASTSTLKGILLFSDGNGNVVMASSTGTNRNFVTFTGALSGGIKYYNIDVDWSGITGEVFTLNVDGVDFTTTTTNGWVGDSETNLLIGTYNLAGNNQLNGQYKRFEWDDWFTNFQDGKGFKISTSNLSVVGTIINDNSSFWDIKEDDIDPILLTNGESKYLSFESDGISSILADPLNNNLDTERAVNGDFYTDANWTKTGDAAIVDNKVIFPTYGDTIILTRLKSGTESHETYFTELNILKLDTFNMSMTIDGGNSQPHFNLGLKKQLIKSVDNSNRGIYVYSSGAGSEVDFVSVKKVLSINANGSYSFKIKPVNSNVHIISTEIDGNGNGYYINIQPTEISIYKNDIGIPTLLDTQSITVDDYSGVSYVISANSIEVFLNGTLVVSTNDTTYRDTKFITIDEKAGGEISHFTKGYNKYDTSNFSFVSGVANVIHVQGNGAIDFKGNNLEYLPNQGFWDTGNEILQPNDVGLESLFSAIRLSFPKLTYYDIENINIYYPETEGLNQLSLGDSTAASGFDVMIEAYNHYTRTRQSYSGMDTEEILTLLQADVASDPTLISRQDRIFLLSGFNDYAGNKSVEEYTNADNNLLSYLRSENSTCEIVMGSVWNFIFASYNPTGDANVENPAGLSYNKMRDIVEDLTETYGICHARLENANLIYPEDIPDGLHTSNSGTGNKKVSDYFIKRRNEYYGKKIPESVLRVTEKDGVFTDWAVQPYEPLKDANGEQIKDVNGEDIYVIKEF